MSETNRILPMRAMRVMLVLLVGMCALPCLAGAEPAWVRGEVKLNVRSGPGTQFKILSGVATGDEVTILKREEGWTRVRVSNEKGTVGWIPEGYLKPEPPPTIRLEQLEVEVASLRESLGTTRSEAKELRSSNESLTTSETKQRTTVERLTLENAKLRAGARYPEMIAGASILAIGMLVGAMLHRSSNRRPQTRIRL